MKNPRRPKATLPTREQIEHATALRILATATAVLGYTRADKGDILPDASVQLDLLVKQLIGTADPALAWLLLTAVAGAYPHSADVRSLLRFARLGSPREVTLDLLDRALPIAAKHGTADRPMRIVPGVMVDLDASARSDFHNGIQRVARETVKIWGVEHDLTLVAWTDTAGITRSLSPSEELRAAHWGRSQSEIEPLIERSGGRLGSQDASHDITLVVPWQATVVLVEVPLADRCPPLAALAEFSGNTVVAIGYDAIPVVSADLRPAGEANAFTSYLTVIKHSARVAGISTSAAVEFAGFAHALSSQGLAGPSVSEVLLPSDVPPVPPDYHRRAPARPRVLSVGRIEPHKNHAALLHASEVLWREGLDFELELIGLPGWSTRVVDAQLDALRRARRPIRYRGAVSDADLWRAIRDASFTVFVSLHEGFGLPVSESLACGTPVITTRYGSQGQIAEQGGCLTVDPRSDEELISAMRTMLADPETERRLRAEAAARPPRSWRDYADELWSVLVTGEAA
ncbi:glycosyltransferase [Cellulomonas sp. P24]|uniref:glycosyltransferase n=1 Tax=Cellulomonas sp. P24 TaxID=2885206 RepID=UPI00216B2294|nr:glycosyltransferase [Cellulomonas sp. P24]MCR6491763.1 glycosyltransferase [Cellulomonas sp. P24]